MMKLKNGTLYVYIDTSVLVNVNFDLYHPAFSEIKRGVTRGHIIVLWNNILENEFSKHCLESVDKSLAQLKKSGTLNSLKRSEVKKILELKPQDSAKEILEKFKKDFKVKEMNTSLDWLEVFEKYFKMESPFSKEKPREFPDAFVIEMLKRYAEERLHIISSDNDFKEMEKNKSVKVFNKISDFSDHYINHAQEYQKIVNAIKTLLPNNFNNLHPDIKNAIEDTEHFHVDSDESEVEFVSYLRSKAKSVTLLSVDLKTRTAIVSMDLEVTVDLEISSQVNFYDSIDRESVHMGTNSNTVEHKAHVDMDIEIKLNSRLDKILKITTSDFNIYTDTFEIPNEWENTLEEDPTHEKY